MARDGKQGAARAMTGRFEDAFGVVCVLVVATYAAWSLLHYEGWTGTLTVLVACATGLVSLASARAPAGWLTAGTALAGLAVALAVVAALADGRAWLGVASLFSIALLAMAIAAILRRILLASTVSFGPILGAISVYALLGIMFAFTYAAIHHIDNTPFFAGIADPDTSDFVFFSYTTLTTTGYGNLVPAGQPGEMIAGLQMLVGQIFLITLIARLVALWQPGERLRAARARLE